MQEEAIDKSLMESKVYEISEISKELLKKTTKEKKAKIIKLHHNLRRRSHCMSELGLASARVSGFWGTRSRDLVITLLFLGCKWGKKREFEVVWRTTSIYILFVARAQPFDGAICLIYNSLLRTMKINSLLFSIPTDGKFGKNTETQTSKFSNVCGDGASIQTSLTALSSTSSGHNHMDGKIMELANT